MKGEYLASGAFGLYEEREREKARCERFLFDIEKGE